MAGSGLSHGRLAMLLVLLTGALCLLPHRSLPEYGANSFRPLAEHSETAAQSSLTGCSLAGQLITKFWDNDLPLLAMLTLLCGWLAPLAGYSQAVPAFPGPSPAYRRHLWLCVFRE